MEMRGINPNDETRAYLSFLLDHEDGCMADDCPICRTAHHIYDLIRAKSLGPKWPLMVPGSEPTTIH